MQTVTVADNLLECHFMFVCLKQLFFFSAFQISITLLIPEGKLLFLKLSNRKKDQKKSKYNTITIVKYRDLKEIRKILQLSI